MCILNGPQCPFLAFPIGIIALFYYLRIFLYSIYIICAYVFILFYVSTVPPMIQTGSTNLTITVNNPVTLDCEVFGIPQPEITWFKNDAIFSVDGDPAYRLDLRYAEVRNYAT